MSTPHDLYDTIHTKDGSNLPTSGSAFYIPGVGYLIGWGTTVGNGLQNWAPSALFFDVDGTTCSVNTGTVTTAVWKTVTHA